MWQWKNLITNGLSISTVWSKLGFGMKGLSWIWRKVIVIWKIKTKSRMLKLCLSRQISIIIWYYHFVICLDFIPVSHTCIFCIFVCECNWLKTIVSIDFFLICQELEFALICISYADGNNLNCLILLLLLW